MKSSELNCQPESEDLPEYLKKYKVETLEKYYTDTNTSAYEMHINLAYNFFRLFWALHFNQL